MIKLRPNIDPRVRFFDTLGLKKNLHKDDGNPIFLISRNGLLRKRNSTFFLFSLFFLLFISGLFLPLLHNYSAEHGSISIYDRRGILMTHIAKKGGYALPFSLNSCYNNGVRNSCTKFLTYLTIIEDKRFFDHYGIDVIAKIRALKGNISGDTFSGGSTITEQWIKNAYFPNTNRSVHQKLREAILAGFFSIFISKEKVLENYLNSIYFGDRVYGIKAAIKVFFQKNEISQLTDEEILLLLTRINAPSRDIEDPEFQAYFLSLQKRIGIQVVSTCKEFDQIASHDDFPFISREVQAFCDNGTTISEHLFSSIDCSKGEFISTIDAKLGLFTRSILQSTLNGLEKKHVTNAGVFAIHPLTNEVVIYEGSRDFNSKLTDGQVNIIHSERQTGSTMKPFLYLLALKNNLQPDSLLIDRSEKLASFQPGEEYISENYSLKEYGLVRLKKALGNSLNNSSVRLARMLGLQKVYDLYRQYGFHFDFPAEHYGYSLVLGNAEITISELVKSYAKLVPKPENEIIDPEKFLLYKILSDPDNRDISFGVDSILNTSIYQAVKTGTSSNFRDNTVVSYSPDIVIGIWFGNNDNTSMIGVTGITGAGYAWHQIVEEMIRIGYIQDKKIPIPDGIIQIPYCLDSACARQKTTFQKKGTTYYSHILDNIYDQRDIAEKLTAKERLWLEEKGFGIQ